MERIVYRKTLDVHKNGSQFLLQGFETADNLSRVVEISLMASGDAIDFPLEKIEALMYITTPNATEPSIEICTIEDNKVVYNVLPIVEEGITTMQLKLIEASTDGAKAILASPKFSVEVTKSNVDDESAMQTTTFTALEEAMAKAKTVYDERFIRMELAEDCTFRAYYADGTTYETDILKRLFNNGNVLLSESYAHGGTGVRAGEDTDNSKYYSNVSRSESLNAKDMVEDGQEILNETRKHGMYTVFSVDFETGEVEYVSPSFKFKINASTGDLDALGQTYTFNEEVYRVVEEWLATNNVVLSDLSRISSEHSNRISSLETKTEALSTRVTPIELGGTGAESAEGARENLGINALVNSSKEEIIAYLKGDVLWENPDPSAEIDEDGLTIPIDRTQYPRLHIEMLDDTIEPGDDYTYFLQCICVHSNGKYFSSSATGASYRTITVTDTAINFGDCSHLDSSTIPFKIIGYKY